MHEFSVLAKLELFHHFSKGHDLAIQSLDLAGSVQLDWCVGSLVNIQVRTNGCTVT